MTLQDILKTRFLQPPEGFAGEWTEERAMEHCTNYFDNEAVNTCESYGVVDLPNAISTCVADIQVNS